MASSEQEHPYYYPAGVPITPQARRFGFVFAVYVADEVWRDICVWSSGPSRYNTNTDKRIHELLTRCYEGMSKKLAVRDDFVAYEFKVWAWRRDHPQAKKKGRFRLGARLFLTPETGAPWLFIYDPKVNSLSDLKKGNAPEEIEE